MSGILYPKENICQVIRNRWADFLLGEKYFDSTDNAMVAVLRRQEQRTGTLLDDLQCSINRSFLWGHLDHRTLTAGMTEDFENIKVLAKSYADPFSSYFKSNQLLEKIKQALTWLKSDKYNLTVTTAGNWWDWEIGVPQALNDILVLLYDDLSKSELMDYLAIIDRFVPDAFYNNRSVRPDKTVRSVGANQVDITIVKLIQNVLRGNTEEIMKSIRALAPVFQVVVSGDGFYADGSFIQHNDVPYTGSYGIELLDGLSRIILAVQKTPFELKKEEFINLQGWLTNSFIPLVDRGNMMDMVRGRAISRSFMQSCQAGAKVIKSMVRLLPFQEKDIQMFNSSLIADWIKGNLPTFDYLNQLDSYQDIYHARQLIKNEKKELANLEGSILKNFARMDRVVYKNMNLDFSVGLSLSSTRTSRYEPMNKENMRAWFISDGMIYRYDKDTSRYNDDFWATVDYYHLPGTTEEQTELEEGTNALSPQSSFAGGTILANDLGSFGLDFTNASGTVSAKKNWLICGGKIIAVGRNIINSAQKSVETTIENIKLNANSHYSLFVNRQKIDIKKLQIMDFLQVSEIFFSDETLGITCGYKFLAARDLRLGINERVGSWQTVNGLGSDKVIKKKYFTIIQNHPNQEDSYDYVFYPNIKYKDFCELTNTIAVTTGEEAIGITDSANGVISICSFGNEKFDYCSFEVSQALVLLANSTGENLQIALSDPTMLQEKIFVSLNANELEPAQRDANISVLKKEIDGQMMWQIVMDCQKVKGATSKVIFKKTKY